MNQTHIHLLINHLPILGSFLGALVLVQGLWTSSGQTKIAAYNLFIISSIGALIAYITGEGAEEGIQHIQGIVEANIERHQEFALFAFISLIILGFSSFLAILLTLRKSAYARTTAFIILVISVISIVLAARTGYLGSQIRHTEINPTLINPTQKELDEDND